MADTIEQYEERGRRLYPKASKESTREAAMMSHFIELAIETTAKAMFVAAIKSQKTEAQKCTEQEKGGR